MSRRAAALALVLIVAAGCGDDDDDSAPSTTTSTSTTAAPETGLQATVDWVSRTMSIDGDTRFDVAFCEGEAPFLCVSAGGEWLGGIERGLFGNPVADLDAWARAHYASLAQDRTAGCDPDYELVGDDVVRIETAHADGVRYGFTGRIGGRVVERVIGYAVSSDAGLELLVANALGDDGCLAREGELPADVMDDLAPVLDAVARGSRLGDARESWFIGDAVHEAQLVEVTPEAVSVDPAALLNGEEAVVTARIHGAIGPDESLPNSVYVVDDHDEAVRLRVADRLVVELIDCERDCTRQPVDATAFLSGEAVPFGGAGALAEVEIVHGEIVAFREIYLP